MDDIYTTSINESIESLFADMEKRISAEDMQRVRDAYALAAEAHKEQRRKTGEPYIIHPIAVARIIAEELELGANPVIAAFLHDVVEDTVTPRTAALISGTAYPPSSRLSAAI